MKIGKEVKVKKGFNPRKNFIRKDVLKVIKIKGPCRKRIKLEFISTDSKLRQGVSFHISAMKGEIKYNGEIIKESGIRFWSDSPENPIELEVIVTEGIFYIVNVCDPVGNGSVVSGSGGQGLIEKKIDSNKFRYMCNDVEMDEDFDDLVFDLEIIDI